MPVIKQRDYNYNKRVFDMVTTMLKQSFKAVVTHLTNIFINYRCECAYHFFSIVSCVLHLIFGTFSSGL